ncbi:hypothetical protein TNCV_3499431 [Trichonephila clavipes]|nr:hypothetical protein TNCV_3499431 [Trichonephila clavipes]
MIEIIGVASSEWGPNQSPSGSLFRNESPVSSIVVTYVETHVAWGPYIIDTEGRGSFVVKVTDSWLACHEFEPSTTEDPPCRGAMYVKSVDSSNVLPLVW